MKKPTTKKAAAKKSISESASDTKTKKKVVKKEPVAKTKPVEKETTKKVVTKKAKVTSAEKVHEPKVVEKKEVVAKPVAPVVKPVAPKAALVHAPAEKVEHKPLPARQPRPAAPVHRGIHGVGRRKAAIARVWLKHGRGAIVINDRPYDQYFDTEESRLSVTAPLRTVKDASLFDAVANVSGGGVPAQADAVALAIARALLTTNADLRPALRRAGLLTVDSRVKERKKYGRKAARRRFQFVKR